MRIDDEIRARTEAFAADLVSIISRAAVHAVSDALEIPVDRGRAAPRHSSAAALAGLRNSRSNGAPPAPARSAGRVRVARRLFGAKRPPGELAKIVERLAAHIKAHPGQRMEHIGVALGASTAELNLPMRKLLVTKRVKTTGHKRATEYFPA
jgi:hypothetical protein